MSLLPSAIGPFGPSSRVAAVSRLDSSGGEPEPQARDRVTAMRRGLASASYRRRLAEDRLRALNRFLQQIVVAQGELALGDQARAQAELAAGLDAVRTVVGRLLPATATSGSLRQRSPLRR